jgi:hypothetical protein
VGHSATESDGRDILSSSLRTVRRRLFLGRLLRALSLDALIFASLFALALAAERMFAFGLDSLLVLASCGGLWLVTSLSRTFLFGGVDESAAATATDVRLGLKERVASAVYLRDGLRKGKRKGPESRQDSAWGDEWGNAVYQDSVDALRDADVKKHFPLRIPRMIWLATAPVFIAAALWIWMPHLDLLGYDAERQAEAAMRKDVAEAKKDAISELRRLEAQAEDEQNTELQKLVEELRKQMEQHSTQNPQKGKQSEPSGEQAKKRALTQISKQLGNIRKQLSNEKKFQEARKTLQQMQRASLKDAKLTRKLLSALKRRDLKQAGKELQALQKELQSLADKKKSPKGHNKDEKKRLQQMSEELSQLSRRMKASRGLSGGLGQASKGMKGMNFQQANDGLQLSRKELDALAKTLDKMDMLQKAQNALQKAQQKLSKINKHKCPNCGKKRASKPGQKPGGT